MSTGLLVHLAAVAKKRLRSRSGSLSGSPQRDRERYRSPSPDRNYNRSRYHGSPRRSRSRSYMPSRSLSPRNHRSCQYSRSRSRSPRRRRSRTPAPQSLDDNEVTEQFVRTVASEVRGHDEEYERTLYEREKSNPKYVFLNKTGRVRYLLMNS